MAARRAAPLATSLFLGLAVSLAVTAGSVRADWLLAQPDATVRPGSDIEVVVVRAAASDPPLPDRLAFELGSAPPLTSVPARALDGDGAARVRRYRLALPAALPTATPIAPAAPDGPGAPPALLRLALPGGHGILLAVTPQVASGDGVATLANVGRRAGNPEPALSGYEPTYFIAGGHRHTASARFQLSFKYRLFDDDGAVVRWVPPLSGLHFAYTQTSLWDLSGDSKPFRDSSYRPALLYYWQDGPRVGDQRAWRLHTGVEHESNGRDGTRSRSINIAFVQPEWRFPYGERGRYAGLGIKLFSYLDREENPDIAHYRGHATLQLLVGRGEKWLWRSTIRLGTANVGSVQNELSYALRRPIFADTGGYLFIQSFNGYGETLLDYNVRRSGQVRIGFAIVR